MVKDWDVNGTTNFWSQTASFIVNGSRYQVNRYQVHFLSVLRVVLLVLGRNYLKISNNPAHRRECLKQEKCITDIKISTRPT